MGSVGVVRQLYCYPIRREEVFVNDDCGRRRGEDNAAEKKNKRSGKDKNRRLGRGLVPIKGQVFSPFWGFLSFFLMFA